MSKFISGNMRYLLKPIRIMGDVVYIKGRESAGVVSKSRHIAIGCSEEGDREVLGF